MRWTQNGQAVSRSSDGLIALNHLPASLPAANSVYWIRGCLCVKKKKKVTFNGKSKAIINSSPALSSLRFVSEIQPVLVTYMNIYILAWYPTTYTLDSLRLWASIWLICFWHLEQSRQEKKGRCHPLSWHRDLSILCVHAFELSMSFLDKPDSGSNRHFTICWCRADFGSNVA